MDMVDPQPSDWRRLLSRGRADRKVRSLLVAIGAGVILVMLIAATNSVVGAARAISSDSRELSETDEAIRAATVARTIIVLAAVSVEEGEPTPDLGEVEEAVEILETYTAWSTRDFTLSIRALQENLRTAGTEEQLGDAPDPALVAAVENQFRSTFDGLVTTRAELSDALTASEDRLGDISTLAGLALLFVVPTISIAVYRAVTQPDLDHAATAHAAELRTAHDRRRRAAVADGIASLRASLGSRSSALVVSQQLDEMAALVGIGVDGAVRTRKDVDMRTALVSAVNRIEDHGSVPIAGDNGRVMADETQLVTLLAAVIASADNARDRRVEIVREGEHLVVVVSALGVWPIDDVLTAASLWDAEPTDAPTRRLMAARSLAADLDATLTPVNVDGRTGVRLALLASTASDLDVRHGSRELAHR